MHLSRRVALLPFPLFVFVAACGARTGLLLGENQFVGGHPATSFGGSAGAATGHAGSGGSLAGHGGSGGFGGQIVPSECTIASDCPGAADACNPVACVAGTCEVQKPVSCDDGDPCTADVCTSTAGMAICSSKPATNDLDGDGHRAPLPGHKAGDAGSCGDDCDDTSAAAFPGNKEICDGVDNDCNGIIDDNARYTADGTAPVQISLPTDVDGESGGLAFAKTSFLAAYTSDAVGDGTKVFLRPLDPLGNPTAPPATVNATTGDAEGGPVAWTGDRVGLVWSDRRDGDYEIYFNTFGPDGAKTRADVRVTNSMGFSINPTIGWDGTNFYVAWQDDRDGAFEAFGERIGLDGTPTSGETLLASSNVGGDIESPSIAVSSQGIAIAYRDGDSESSTVLAQVLTADLSPKGPAVQLSSGDRTEGISIAFNQPDFLVTWGVREPFNIFGAVVSTGGAVKVPATEISEAGGENRAAAVLPLGDRALLLYSRQNMGSGYDIYSRMLSAALSPLGDAQQLTTGLGDDLLSGVSFGVKGSVGVFFTGKAQGDTGLKNAAYFSHLTCVAGN